MAKCRDCGQKAAVVAGRCKECGLALVKKAGEAVIKIKANGQNPRDHGKPKRKKK